MEFELIHQPKIVSFTDTDINTKDLYVYYFELTNGEAKIHSIDVFVKNGVKGNTYKAKEVFHHEYKPNIMVDGNFEKPSIPDHIWESARHCLVGLVLDCVDKKNG